MSRVRVPSLTPIDQGPTCGNRSGLRRLRFLGTERERRPLPKRPNRAYRPVMASIVERPKKDGDITYQVKWRLGGSPPVQTENFTDPDSAETFKQLVNLHDQHWPPGWVRGRGFVEEPEHPDDVPLLDYAHLYVDKLTGI